MINDEPTMTNDELIAAFDQLNDPAWLASLPEPPSYREKQYKRYRQYSAMGWQDTAQDALWRAASEADMLAPREHSHGELTPARVTELITLLGWAS